VNALAKLGTMSLGKVLMLSLVVSGLYYMIAYDAGDTWRAVIAQTIQTKADLEEKTRKIDKDLEEVNNLREAQEKDAERLNILLGYIPEKLSNFELMKTLSNEAKAVGVNINQIRDKGGQATTTEFYEEIGVDIDLEGSFSQLVLFLSNLTRLNQILTLESLSLRAAQGDSSLLMSAQVNGYRYVSKRPGGEVAK
jgi:type IV pilus assembly protein PilO